MFKYIKSLIKIEDINIRYIIKFAFGLLIGILLLTVNFVELLTASIDVAKIGEFIKAHWPKLIGIPLTVVCVIGLGWHIKKFLKEDSKDIDEYKQKNKELNDKIQELNNQLAIYTTVKPSITPLLNEAEARQKVWFRNYTN